MTFGHLSELWFNVCVFYVMNVWYFVNPSDVRQKLRLSSIGSPQLLSGGGGVGDGFLIGLSYIGSGISAWGEVCLASLSRESIEVSSVHSRGGDARWPPGQTLPYVDTWERALVARTPRRWSEQDWFSTCPQRLVLWDHSTPGSFSKGGGPSEWVSILHEVFPHSDHPGCTFTCYPILLRYAECVTLYHPIFIYLCRMSYC